MPQPPPPAPISERRGAVVAGALICAVLLVVGYGSGVGVVPARPGDVADGEPAPGEAGAGEGEPDEGPTAPARETGSTSLVNSSNPRRSGKGTTSPNVVQSAGSVLPGIVPPSTTLPTTPPGTTPPGTTPPGTSPPPGATPPPGNPPPECTGLTGSLVQALIGYLAGPNPDAALVQRVSDVLGLGAMLPSDSLLGGVVTPLGGAVSTLGSTLDPNTNLTSALVPDAGLIPDLRALLGVDVTGLVTVTAQQLTAQLDAVLGGC